MTRRDDYTHGDTATIRENRGYTRQSVDIDARNARNSECPILRVHGFKSL